MYAVVSPEHIQLPTGSVMRMPGTWEDYCALRDSRGDQAVPRIKYRDGEILLMSPLPRHGREANILADIIKVLLESQGRNYEAFTPITMELPTITGIEPDYCFYIENVQAVLGKDRLNWQSDPPPDLVIEVDVTSYTSVSDFLPYQVPEVWVYKQDKLYIYVLHAGQYELCENSRCFPGVALPELIEQCFATAKQQGTGVAISQLRQALRSV
jgi:Uma2 family endonuclease